MKKLLPVLTIAFLIHGLINAQVINSGKSTVRINNKPESKAAPVEAEIVMPAAVAAVNALPAGVGKFYALIIGINDYQDPNINSLDFCIRDAEAFYGALTANYTFEKENVKFLKNATMADIVTSLDYFAKIVKPIDSFVIFYAGHGVWNPQSETGFWLPSDARKNSTLNWFRNSALRDYLREVNSRHTLLITDACFAGSIFKTRAAFSDAGLAVNKLYELPSRKAMTSGTAPYCFISFAFRKNASGPSFRLIEFTMDLP